MAFILWSKTLQRFFSLWFSFRDWIGNSFISPLARLIRLNKPTPDDIETGNRKHPIEESNETGNHEKVETVTLDPQGEFVSGGLTGIVELLDDGNILKSPWPGSEREESIRDIATEADIYRRIGPHERLVRLVSHSSNGIVLEYMPNGDVKTYLQKHDNESIPMSLKLKWAYQTAEAVNLLHSNGVIHCDIKPQNLLLDADLNIKIIDFSGSSMDGSKQTAGESTRFFLPRYWRNPSTVTTDLFALGSTIYQIFQGISPYEETPSYEVETLFKEREFPDVSALPCGQIINQCWLSHAHSAGYVQACLQDVIQAQT